MSYAREMLETHSQAPAIETGVLAGALDALTAKVGSPSSRLKSSLCQKPANFAAACTGERLGPARRVRA